MIVLLMFGGQTSANHPVHMKYFHGTLLKLTKYNLLTPLLI